MADKAYYFYVLYCADDTFYGGFTDDVLRRFATHQNGQGAKYTKVKKRHPLHLIYSERFDTKSEAMKAEYAFKHQTRQHKEKFLQEKQIDWRRYRQTK